MKSWSREEIRRVGHQVVDLIADHLTSLDDEPAFAPVPPEILERFRQSPAPAHGASPDEVLGEFSDTVEPYPFGNGHPRFWGWVNSPPAVMGVFADALAAAMNPSCAGGNHAAIYVERQVIQWFRDMLGFAESSMGLLVSGGSMATLTALAVARHVKSGVDVRATGLRDAPAPFAFYMTSEGHTCARKAIELLGFGSETIRIIPTNEQYCMRVDALDSTVADDRARGIRPIAVVATAGTTNTGAIDDIGAIATVCRRHGIWLHVDAAYGGPAILTGEYGPRLTRAFAGADSVALDPHKWMFVPVEAGFVIVRDGDAMRAAFSLVPPYIRSAGSPTGVYGLPWFSEYGFQQTRGFRALKVWMTIKHEGLDGLKSAIEDNIALARHLADRIRTTPNLELIASGLSVVCFRYVGGDSADRSAAVQYSADEPAIATLNRAILDRLQLGGDAFITSTELKGRFVLRACIVNFRSTRRDIDRLIDAVLDIAESVRSEV